MSAFTVFKSKARQAYRALQQWHRHRLYSKRFRSYMKLRGICNSPAVGEVEYLQTWRQLCPRVEPYSYRLFSHYMGPKKEIIPEDVGHSFVEECLNPPAYRVAYSDKNLFPRIVGKENVPRTIVCRINGSCLLDGNYKAAFSNLSAYIGSERELVLKPTIGSCSGMGILKFTKQGAEYVNKSPSGLIVLTREFLMNYSSDFCLQEVVHQHPFMSCLNGASVNTIRLCVYRSVKDDTVHVMGAILRIGRKGVTVDNIHAGGRFVGIDIATGKLGNCVYDQYGEGLTEWNGIDYSKQEQTIPFWDEVLRFSRMIGEKIVHHRLIALDVALTESGRPILIEYNIGCFSYWLFQYTGQTVFGPFTNEIITFCKQRGKTVS